MKLLSEVDGAAYIMHFVVGQHRCEWRALAIWLNGSILSGAWPCIHRTHLCVYIHSISVNHSKYALLDCSSSYTASTHGNNQRAGHPGAPSGSRLALSARKRYAHVKEQSHGYARIDEWMDAMQCH